MSTLLILGTDTDAGKTTFCATWLSHFADRYAYWKPLETGEADSGRIRSLAPGAQVFPSLLSLKDPVAPLLAARREWLTLPSVEEIVARTPQVVDRCHLLVETFGSPFSPLTDDDLQIELVKRLDAVRVLVTNSTVGTIGRTLQCLLALRREGVPPHVVVVMGDDEFAIEQLRHHAGVPVMSLKPPREWSQRGFERSSYEQRETLAMIESVVPGSASIVGGCTGDATHTPSPRPSPPTSGGRETGLERDARALWHPYTSLKAPRPLMCVEAKDEFLVLDDGRRVIDGISSWWTIQHGHRDRELVNALQAASDQIDHVLFAGMTHPWGIDLAEMLLASAELTHGRVFYSDNGSTAVEVALKMAYQFWCLRGETGRTRFVGFENGYHGDTFGAMSVSRDPVFFGRFEPLLFQADILPLDPDRLDAHLSHAKKQTAAILVEPLVQGAGGMRMHTPQTLLSLFEVARKHGVLFIADEVMTAGRLRTPWAFQSAGIKPDLICAAKTIAGGMLPLAATLVSRRIVEPFDGAETERTFFHGHSFTGWPLACAVGVVNQRKLIRLKSYWPPTAIEAMWHRLIEPLKGQKGIKDVRILGSIAAVEIDVPGGYLAQVGRTMREAALAEGVFLRPLGNVLYAMPPYCTTRASLEQISRAMQAACEKAIKQAGGG